MSFNTIQYFVFLPFVTVLYFLLPLAGRNIFLLAASYFFYMAWDPKYGALLLLSTTVDFTCGLIMQRHERWRRVAMGVSVLINMGSLCYFKYSMFLVGQAAAVGSWLTGEPMHFVHYVVLPVGISFFTFQSLSYTFDVYFRKRDAETNFIDFALFVSFFPQLVAGPIERSMHLLPQFKIKHEFTYDNAVFGSRLILIGLMKKVLVADRLALFVDAVYNNPGQHSGPVLALATIAFALQIYADFSGYSDIAIGSARILGFEMMMNFNRPYIAQNIRDFWQRWHISLTTWFRDYVYFPLGGNRTGRGRWILSIFAVFLLSGIWHGANWTYLIWGLLHALYYVIGFATQGLRERSLNALGISPQSFFLKVYRIVFVFVLVCFAWIFFRAASLTDALTVIGGLGEGWTSTREVWSDLTKIYSGFGLRPQHFVLSLGIAVLLESVLAWDHRDTRNLRFFSMLPGPARYAVYAFFTLMLLNLGVVHEVPFIYFQF